VSPVGVDRAAPTGVLTPRQRHEIASLATEVSYGPRAVVYREHAPEAFIFVCREGALKSFRELRSGKRRVMTFRFPGDLFGLAEDGRYVNTVQAVTHSKCYRIPVEQLKAKLRQDAEMQYQVLTRLTHELREAQRRTIMLGHRTATGRLAMFLNLLQKTLAPGTPGTIPLPMSRSDVASFLGVSLESISRATSKLVKSGVISFRGVHEVRVLDQHGLDELAADL
jgi:CRP-like cAMP-binding protein